MENALLLFSPECPCWDEETVRLAGDDSDSLMRLLECGEVRRLGGGYVLTPRGEESRRGLSAAICVPVLPVNEFLTDEAAACAALEHNRMCVFLDGAFKTQWGIKEVTLHEKFPVVPGLPDDSYFTLENGTAKAVWPEHSLVKSFLSAFPHSGVAARGLPVPGQAGLDAWAKVSGAVETTLTVDFVLRSRYDFNHYKGFADLESDRFRFYNADLLYAVKCPGNLAGLLPVIGKLHIFTLEQRHVYLPGYYDIDVEEQEDWTLFCIVTDTESQLEETTRVLRGWGHALIEPARPLYLIGTSIERLRAQKEIKDTIYDWFQEETVRIMRPDAPDGE